MRTSGRRRFRVCIFAGVLGIALSIMAPEESRAQEPSCAPNTDCSAPEPAVAQPDPCELGLCRYGKKRRRGATSFGGRRRSSSGKSSFSKGFSASRSKVFRAKVKGAGGKRRRRKSYY